MIFKRKQYCVDCHFFVQEERVKGTDDKTILGVTESQKESARKKDFSWIKRPTTLACYFGVWDEGYDLPQKDRYKVICSTNRNNFCFWWREHPGMLLPAAKILQERESKDRVANRDRRITKIGIWIAALALIANCYLTIAKENKYWPFLQQSNPPPNQVL